MKRFGLFLLVGLVLALIQAPVVFGGAQTDSLTLITGGKVRADTGVSDTFTLSAYDTDTGPAYVDFITFTSGTTPTCDLATSVTIGGNVFYYAGGTDVAIGDGGTGASLVDPDADRVMFWDDSETAVDWLTMDANHFSYSTTTLSIAADAIDDTLIDWGIGAGQVSIADLSGNQISGALLWDLGGATSLEIPNVDGPTVDVAGEIAIDTNSGGVGPVDQGIITYYDGTRQMWGIAVDAEPTDDGYVLAYNATTDKYEFVVQTGGSPAGNDTEIQYNNSGVFGAEANFTYNQGTNTLTVTSGKIVIPEWEYTGNPTLDAINAAANSEITFTNSDATYEVDLVVEADSSFYFGPSGTDGTWRMVRSSNNLVFERRETGAYVTKFTMTP